MMAAFKGCECNDGAYSPGYENRQILSMIQDGAPVLVRATRHSLNSSGIGDEQTIRVVESLLKIYTFRHEKVDMITLSNPSGLGHSVGVIIDAILEDACNWVSLKYSTCILTCINSCMLCMYNVILHASVKTDYCCIFCTVEIRGNNRASLKLQY